MTALIIVGVFALIAALAILRGVVLSYMWAWFIVPLGAAPISIVHAIGISLLIGMFTSHLKQDDDDNNKVWEGIAQRVAGTLFAFGLGYLLSGLMS